MTPKPPRGRRWSSFVLATEFGHASARHGGGHRGHMGHVQRPVERRLPHVAEPLEPFGPEHVDRDHGHGHGPDHRVAQHRPVGGFAARVRRLHDGPGADGWRHRVLRPQRHGRRARGQAVRVGGRAGRGRRARRPGRHVDGLHHRLRRSPRVHRDAGRLPRLAGRDLPHRRQAGPDARAPPEHLPADRRRSQGLAR